MRPVLGLILIYTALSAAGCASYATPGRGADLRMIGAGDTAIGAALSRKPLATFPTAIAVARLQSTGYHSQTAESFGTGRFSIVTTRDVEKPEQIERLARLPMVLGIAPMNRLLLPPNLDSEVDLRNAAAQLHADLLLMYTLDTQFYVNDMSSAVTLISLGFAPIQNARVVTTASALLVDTRNGYVYGLAEATVTKNHLTSAWDSDHAVDATRVRTETEAFEKLVGEFEKTWAGVLMQYAGTRPVAAN
jgi:hypothetical protein